MSAPIYDYDDADLPPFFSRWKFPNRHCFDCEVEWHTDGDGEECWCCGKSGSSRFVSRAPAPPIPFL